MWVYFSSQVAIKQVILEGTLDGSVRDFSNMDFSLLDKPVQNSKYKGLAHAVETDSI